MKKVILESPYAGNIQMNIQYARACVKHSLSKGESPIASHLLYTQDGILDDANPTERLLGINAGLAWREVADLHVFYVDYGISKGMKFAINYAEERGMPIEFRYLYPTN